METTIKVLRDKNMNVLVVSNSEYSRVGDSKFDIRTAMLITQFQTDLKPFRVMLQTWKAFKAISEYQKKNPYGLRLVK